MSFIWTGYVDYKNMTNIQISNNKTHDKGNSTAIIVSWAPEGDESPSVLIQITELRKILPNNLNLFHV
jgi:hypothetical protein